ncbi:MAG: hypothetical protein KQI35_05630 [Bacteroidetes bacterium]|nr:hypothetical protein [Bacteroidota bacterium]
MKRLKIILLLTVMAIIASAQPPQAFKYQVVVRDNVGTILQNQNIGMRISIHDFTTSTIVYQETFSKTTNQFGLVNLAIGKGSPVIGNFNYIDWSIDSKFLEIEIDTAGGNNYVSLGTSELQSVPYALYAEKVVNNDDNDWTASGNDLYAANSGSVGIGTSAPNGKLAITAPSGSTTIPSTTKGLVIKDGLLNSGNEFEITEFLGTPKFRVLDNGYTIVGTDSKGIQMRTDGSVTDIESLGADLAINYQSGNNTLLNVTSGHVGIGSTGYLSNKLEVVDDFDAFFAKNNNYNNYGWVGNQFAGIRGYSDGGTIGDAAVKGWADGNAVAADFHGSVVISGSISKGSGSFLIDHPLDPENKLLRHNFMESPENLVVYRGKIKLNSKGVTKVMLPDYFEALTKENEATVTLTSIGKPFLTGYEWEQNYKGFKVYGEPYREVSWVVYADRDDPVIQKLARPVVEEKGQYNPYCEKGKLLYPEAYGYPESSLNDYDELLKMKEQINQKNNSQ